MMKFFDTSELELYKSEVREKWGDTSAYKEHAEKTKDYSAEKWTVLTRDMDGIMAEFALCMKHGTAPDSDRAQSLVRALQDHITDNYYRCTKEILAGLGQMYVADERFQTNIDRHADGTAGFVCKAIEVYCSK